MFVTIVVNRRILDDPLDSFGNYGNTRNKFIDTYIIKMILNVSGSPTMTETIDRIVKESMEGPDDDAHYRFKVCIPGRGWSSRITPATRTSQRQGAQR